MRRLVVHEDLLLEVLAGVGEVEAERLDVGALLGEVRRRVHAHDLAAERDDDVLEERVTAEAGEVAREVHGVVAPLLQRRRP